MYQNLRWLTVSTTLTSQNKQLRTLVWVFDIGVGLWFMTIDYVNSEILWLQNTLQGYLQTMLAVEDDELSQI